MSSQSLDQESEMFPLSFLCDSILNSIISNTRTNYLK